MRSVFPGDRWCVRDTECVFARHFPRPKVRGRHRMRPVASRCFRCAGEEGQCSSCCPLKVPDAWRGCGSNWGGSRIILQDAAGALRSSILTVSVGPAWWLPTLIMTMSSNLLWKLIKRTRTYISLSVLGITLSKFFYLRHLEHHHVWISGAALSVMNHKIYIYFMYIQLLILSSVILYSCYFKSFRNFKQLTYSTETL